MGGRTEMGLPLLVMVGEWLLKYPGTSNRSCFFGIGMHFGKRTLTMIDALARLWFFLWDQEFNISKAKDRMEIGLSLSVMTGITFIKITQIEIIGCIFFRV